MNNMTIEEIRTHLSDVRSHAEHHRDLATSALLLLGDALGLSRYDIVEGGGCEDCAFLGEDLCGCGEGEVDAPKDPAGRAAYFAKRRLAKIVVLFSQGTGNVHLGIERAIIALHDHTPHEIAARALHAETIREKIATAQAQASKKKARKR